MIRRPTSINAWPGPDPRRGRRRRGRPDGVAQPQTDFIHNAARPLGGEIGAAGVPDGNVVIMTEEDFTGPCSASGRIVAADITDSLGGEPAANSTPAAPYRMNALSAFHPTQDAGDNDRAERLLLGDISRSRARPSRPPGTGRAA